MTPIPERECAERIARAIAPHVQPRWLTEACLADVCKKIVAHRAFVRDAFDSLDADPQRLPERDVVLREQTTNQLEDKDYWLEHAGHLRRELDDCLAIIARIEQRDRTPRQDVRTADEDDRRLSQI